MKIAITAGIKTSNITEAVISNINSGGNDLVTLPSLNELIEYIDCGYRLERIIIIEQAITSNDEIRDINEIRKRVNTISSIIGNKQSSAEVVFITRYDDLADVIYEESLSVRANSLIVVKDRPYSTSFFIGIMTDEFSKIDSDIVYTALRLEDKNELKETDEWEDTDEEEWEDTEESNDDEEDIDSKEWDASSNDEWDNTEEIEWEGTGGPEDRFQDNIERDTGTEEYMDSRDEDWDDEEIESKWEGDSNEDESEVDSIIWDDTSMDTDDNKNTDNSYDNKENEYDVTADTVIDDTDTNDYDTDIVDGIYNSDERIADESKGEESDWVDEVYKTSNNDIDDTDKIYKDEQADNKNSVDDEIDNIYNTQNEINRYSGRASTGFFNRNKSRKQRGNSLDGITINIDGGITTSELAHRMESFASRGNGIVVTGSGGTGASTVALNMANFIASIGYSVIIVDMDTKHRAQSYMSKEAYNAIEPGSSDLMSTINSTAPAERFARIIRPGIHMLSMWVGGDCNSVEEVIQKEKLARFINSVKASYNFIIYDIPFESAVGYLHDITFIADNIVNVVDCSNWGITKFMLDCCNIASEEMQETIFNRTEILLNRCVKGRNSFLGRRVKGFTDILRILDDKVIDLTGIDSGMYFTNMHIVGGINYDTRFEDGWYSDRWYSDTKEGRAIFAQLVAETVLY